MELLMRTNFIALGMIGVLVLGIVYLQKKVFNKPASNDKENL